MNPDHPGNNPYDFIMNDGQQKSSKFSIGNFSGGGNKAFIVRIALIVGAAIILMIVISVVMSLTGGSKDDKASLIKLAQSQQAIVTNATDGARNARSRAKNNSAVTTNLSLLTQQAEYLAYLKTQGITIKAKELALGQSAETAATLKAAVESSTYDTTYAEIMQKQLENYAQEIKDLHEQVSGPKLKTILSHEYDQVQLLITQLNAKDTFEDTTPQS